MSHVSKQTERTRLRRKRGFYDRQTIETRSASSAMDRRWSCRPFSGGKGIVSIGTPPKRGVKAQEGTDVCLTVSLLDRRPHSANYRSVVFGQPVKIADRP